MEQSYIHNKVMDAPMAVTAARGIMTTTEARTDGNNYLEGNYAPIADEITAFDLPVIGELPAELEGRYLRNGPNPLSVADPMKYHWFTGDGMVHGVRLQDGAAKWYRNRYVGSSRLSELRGQPDIPGRNWNGSISGPNTNVGASPAQRGQWSKQVGARSS